MKKTPYFENIILTVREEIRRNLSYVEKAISEPHTTETQEDGRTRRWIYVPSEEKYMRVIVEPDGETVHNAFLDRDFTRKQRRMDR